MECASCSAEVQPEQRFCPSCGSRLAGVVVPPRVVAPASTDTSSVGPLSPPAPQVTGDDELWSGTVPEPPPPLDPAPFFPPPEPPTARIEVVTRGGDTLEQPAVDAAPLRTAALAVAALSMMCALGAASLVEQVHYRVTGDRSERRGFGLDDLVSSHAGVVIVAGVLVLVGLLAAWRRRALGVGLVGGAGLGVAASVAMGVAEANRVLDAAEVAVLSTPGTFTITVTRDLGYFVAIGAAALGLIVFLLGVRSAHRRRPRWWVVVPGLLGTVVVVIGALLPQGGATFVDNFGQDTVPPVVSWLRLAALAAVPIAGFIGFLAGSRWGAALVVAGVAVPVWQVVASLADLDGVVGGFLGGNIGDGDPATHLLTVVGLGVVLLTALIGLVLRPRPR